MSAKRSIARFLAIRAEYPDSYALWHSRIATHGVKNESNCHPFRVGGDKLTYLAHNGVLSVCQPKDDKRSDTRVFAEEVLPAMGGVASLDNETIFEMVCAWARGSKMVVLTIDPNAKKNIYLINEKSGEWDDNNIWWSNTRHRPYVSSSYFGNYDYRKGANDTYVKHPGLTKVISIANKDSGFWEESKSIVVRYREYEPGDIWDQGLYGFRTPLPGSVIAPEKTTSLELVKILVEEPEEEDEDEDKEEDEMEIECSWCNQKTDLEDDYDYCTACMACFDCGVAFNDCMCYRPGSSYAPLKYNGYLDF